jgi:predicted secreted protein
VTIFGGVVVYTMAWWIILFMALPFGVRAPDRPERGHAASAPEKPRLAIKMGVATVLAAIVTAIVAYVIDAGLVSFRPPRP